MFSEVSRSRNGTTSTSGLSASIVRRAESTFGSPSEFGRVGDLALEVRLVDDVRVDDPERADAGGREVERGGRAEAAGADQEDPRVEQLQLALLADLRDQQVAAVARRALRPERARQVGREAVPLPVGVAAGERDRPVVAELGQRLRGERRAGARRAVEEHGPRAVRRDVLDPRLEVPARHVHRAGDAALLPLVALAHVDEERRVVGVQQLACARRVDFLDRGLGGLQKLAVARHAFDCIASPWPVVRISGPPRRQTTVGPHRRRRLRAQSDSDGSVCAWRLMRD